MNKKLYAGVVFIIASLFINIRVDAETTGWTLLPDASDEFLGSHLDETKWKKGIWYDTSSSLAFKDENVYLLEGNMVIEAKKENYRGKNYTIGAVESKFDVPGSATYVEVRAKVLNKSANILSAIWLQSSPLSKYLNPNPEIDVMETFNYTHMTSTLHTWDQEPAIHFQRGKNSWNTGVVDMSQEYHTYGLERNENKLRFYFDRQLVWEKETNISSFVELSRHLVLSLEGHLGKPNDKYLPEKYLIDYVRTYYNSSFLDIPQDGEYQLMNKKSGMVLSTTPGNNQLKSQLIQTSNQNLATQTWILEGKKLGRYTLQNKANQLFVDLKEDVGVNQNGNPIIQYTGHGKSNQEWFIIPTTQGAFKIVSSLSGKSLAVKDASIKENAFIIQWTYEDNEDLNDEWILIK
ncbi:RICIN domain-containing protein [Enterococcus sp. LJL98]